MCAFSPKLDLPPLYSILDPEQTRSLSSPEVLRRLLDGGVRLLQLRAKSLSSREFLRLALEARELTHVADCRLVINDRVDIALACSADGVHLGQEDLPLEGARKLTREKIVGISTHDIAQARQAERDGADYIGFGPIFGTKTKDTGYAARGLAMLAEIRQAVKLPIVAIGGITEANAREVWQAGADSVAIISDILSTGAIAKKVERILSLYPAS